MSVEKLVDQLGDGKRFPNDKDYVAISYSSWFHNPDKPDNKYCGQQIGQPMNSVTIQLGNGVLLAACELEIVKMSVGERAFLIIPSSKAYAEDGIPDLIPANSDIVILVELLDVKDS